MALFSVDTAPAAGTGVALSAGAPPWTPRNPADFRFAHAALEPVAAPLLHHHDLCGGRLVGYVV